MAPKRSRSAPPAPQSVMPTAGLSDSSAAASPTRDQLPAGYAAFLADVLARVRAAQLRTAIAVNRGLVVLYWELGREIATRQTRERWGAEVVNRLADDLRRAFPAMRGFTRRNLYYARAFYAGYAPPAVAPAAPGGAAPAIVQQPVAQTASLAIQQRLAVDASTSGSPEPLASLPWGHNILLLEQLDDSALRLWYAREAVAHGWSRNVLGIQVESRLHARLGRADQTTNFAATLPPAQSDLARAVIKDPYNFEFLAIAQDAHERHVEAGLIAHMREFLLELGTGFLYAGNQYRLVVGGREFFLDLLFYHKKLRCWVVLDLKTGAFEPEYAGKMHFYLNAVDAQLRDEHDGPSVGLILCKSKDAVVAESHACADCRVASRGHPFPTDSPETLVATRAPARAPRADTTSCATPRARPTAPRTHPRGMRSPRPPRHASGAPPHAPPGARRSAAPMLCASPPGRTAHARPP